MVIINNFGKTLSFNECVLINEASSSATSFFSYNSDLTINQINGKTKLSLDHRISDYAKQNDALGYYNIIRNNNIIADYITHSNCSKFKWSLLATGGMRAVNDLHGIAHVENFYTEIKKLFNANPQHCAANICQDISLNEAKTITGGEEGRYAWITLSQIKYLDNHIVFDLGGQTGQITHQNDSYSDYLGKERAICEIGQYNMSVCYNDQNQYSGIQCRANIQNYIVKNFANKLPILQEHSFFYAI